MSLANIMVAVFALPSLSYGVGGRDRIRSGIEALGMSVSLSLPLLVLVLVSPHLFCSEIRDETLGLRVKRAVISERVVRSMS